MKNAEKWCIIRLSSSILNLNSIQAWCDFFSSLEVNAQIMEGSTGNSKNVPKKYQLGQNNGLLAVHGAPTMQT